MPMGILRVGAHVPTDVIDNARIAEWTGAPAEWVTERTGILERRYAGADTTTSSLAAHAVRQILDESQDSAERIRGLIVATCTPDVPQPATAAILQDRLGLRDVMAFDVNAVCSGFLYGLTLAEGLLNGMDRQDQLLLVGADKFSTIMDRADRRTVSLFGDGAGAVLLGHVPDGYGVLASRLVSNGELHHYVGVEAGGTRAPLDEAAHTAGDHLLRMDGRAVKEYAISTMRKLIEQVLDETGLAVQDIDRFVFHQANTRLLEFFASDLGIPPDRVPLTAPRWGNTAGASIPLTLRASLDERPVERGGHVLFAAVGGGMTAAATILRWY
ncbi:3-oxoacyl-ACP synthase III family protein [Streptomyces tsukubensis]|uniref:3-oxoacyl-ACP synthase n=1 Tax=Streptomyces tsukubensis TaxID=83656 RepID=A0A1V4AFX5_9ACTN|nr:ketoacyl-ACP synthase III [Streptomyces tsukubensis]OON82578.1 3-oxoacyl-ACP synthase [Streptomyces tsukubensis]QFR92258.1 beta-ketoacyl-ACP synthase 3 [Streptomyces tsukubensis]